MTIRFFECRSVIADSDCRLMLIGEEAEVTAAFADHLVRSHGDVRDRGGAAATAEGRMQNAVFVSKTVCYVPDEVERTEDGGFRVPGPGVVIRRFYEDAAAAFDCRCLLGTTGGPCKADLIGHGIWCTKDVCTECGWATSIPTVVKPRTLLSEFRSLEAPPWVGDELEV